MITYAMFRSYLPYLFEIYVDKNIVPLVQGGLESLADLVFPVIYVIVFAGPNLVARVFFRLNFVTALIWECFAKQNN